MNLEQAERMVHHGFDAFSRGDMEAATQIYGDDVVFDASDFMNAGPYRGRAGFAEWTGRWTEAWDSVRFEIGRVQAVGERHFVAEVGLHVIGRESGIEMEFASGWIFEIGSDDLCVYVEAKSSPEDAIAAAGDREAGRTARD